LKNSLLGVNLEKWGLFNLSVESLIWLENMLNFLAVDSSPEFSATRWYSFFAVDCLIVLTELIEEDRYDCTDCRVVNLIDFDLFVVV
jgi:hypothetical protein